MPRLRARVHRTVAEIPVRDVASAITRVARGLYGAAGIDSGEVNRMTTRNLDAALEAFEAALPYLREALPPDELSSWVELHSREIMGDAHDELERMYAASRIENMLEAAATAIAPRPVDGGA